MIELKNIFVSYNREYFALYDITLKIKAGERVALIGEEGSGKTALLRLIAGLEKPKSGEAYIKDIPLNKVDYEHDVSVGYISDRPVFFEHKSVYKNLEWVLKIRDIPKEEWDERINKALGEFDLTKLAKEKVGTLCKSDRKLVQIARLSLRKIEILLCDDLLQGMDGDKNISERITNAFKKLCNSDPKNKVVITTFTDEKDCEGLANRKIYIKFGSVEDTSDK